MLKLIFNSTYILHSDGRGVWTPSAPCDPTTVPFLSDVPTSSHIIRKIPLKIIATFCRAPNSVRGVCRFVALFVCFVCVLDYFHTQQFATMHPFTKCDHCTRIDTECLQHGGVILFPLQRPQCTSCLYWPSQNPTMSARFFSIQRSSRCRVGVLKSVRINRSAHHDIKRSRAAPTSARRRNYVNDAEYSLGPLQFGPKNPDPTT